jgi:phosphinothricin acetyltransferase
MDIRTAQKNDVPAMQRIYAPYVSGTAVSFEYDVPTVAEMARRFDDISPRFPWLVCDIGGTAAGYAYACRHETDAAYAWNAEISVYVDAAHHRKGIAAALYRCMMPLLAMQGYVNLYASITGANDKSLAFHRALGFAEVGTFRRAGYKLGAWHDVVWLKKALRDFPDSPKPPVGFAALNTAAVAAVLDEHTQALRRRTAGRG